MHHGDAFMGARSQARRTCCSLSMLVAAQCRAYHVAAAVYPRFLGGLASCHHEAHALELLKGSMSGHPAQRAQQACMQQVHGP